MKLFKKAMAAVLAGVMALSMVACAPGGNDKPGTDVPDSPATTAEGQFFDMLNGYLDAKEVKEAIEGNGAIYPAFSNELKAEAEAVLDAIANGNSVVTNGKVTSRSVKAGDKTELLKKVDAVGLINKNGYSWTVLDTTFTASGTDAAVSSLKFDADKAKAYIKDASVDGQLLTKVTTKVTDGSTTKSTVEYKAAYQIGVATKTIDGVECTVIVLKKVA